MADTARKSPGGVPGKRRLRTADDVRRFLADTVNRLNAGQLDPMIAGRLGYLCNILASIIKTTDLESRLTELEKAMEQGR